MKMHKFEAETEIRGMQCLLSAMQLLTGAIDGMLDRCASCFGTLKKKTHGWSSCWVVGCGAEVVLARSRT